MTTPPPVPGGHPHFLMVGPASPEGWRVWCVYHGSLGTYLSPVQAFLIGMRHDQDVTCETPPP